MHVTTRVLAHVARARCASTSVVAAAVAIFGVALGVGERARACSPPVFEDPGFRLLRAPAGGVWWVRDVDERFVDDTITLVADDGTEVVTAIVSLGAQGAAAIRVPDAPAGTAFDAPQAVGDRELASGARLVVTEGAPPTLADAPPPPSIAVEQREVRTSYESVLTLPYPLCTAGGEYGLWSYGYGDRPFLIVDDPGDDVVLDVQLQPLDEEPFADVESANEILFDARTAAALDVHISAPPETVDVFAVHARVRRIADGVASDVVTLEVAIDDAPPEKRLELVGCSCASTSPGSLALPAVVLVALRVRRRREARA